MKKVSPFFIFPLFKGHLLPLTFQQSSGLTLAEFFSLISGRLWPSARYRFWQEEAEPIYCFLMVRIVLWNSTTSTVKPVHPERRISPPSLNESEPFGVNGCDKVLFPALSLKVRFHLHDPILHILLHFSSSISPRKACIMSKRVWSPLP